jgi:hypothetical protein
VSDQPASKLQRQLAAVRPRTAGLEAAFARIGLPAWFVIIDVLWVIRLDTIGVDARHYQRAANEWLAGGNPWSVSEFGFPYAAGPHTLLPYVASSVLPLTLSVAFWLAVGAAASLWLVRRLDVPIWWVLFPPLTHAIWNGNPQTLVLALLVVGTALAGAAAAIVKLYALIPLTFHPPRLVVATVALVLTLPFLPWQLYIEEGLGIGTHVATAWNGSAWRLPILLPPTLLALWVLRRDGGEWYSAPAVMPATQFYYVSLVMPAVIRRPILAAVLAMPAPLLVPIMVIALAVRRLWTTRSGLNQRAESPTPALDSRA